LISELRLTIAGHFKVFSISLLSSAPSAEKVADPIETLSTTFIRQFKTAPFSNLS